MQTRLVCMVWHIQTAGHTIDEAKYVSKKLSIKQVNVDEESIQIM
jgi:hypothetical protein